MSLQIFLNHLEWFVKLLRQHACLLKKKPLLQISLPYVHQVLDPLEVCRYQVALMRQNVRNYHYPSFVERSITIVSCGNRGALYNELAPEIHSDRVCDYLGRSSQNENIAFILKHLVGVFPDMLHMWIVLYEALEGAPTVEVLLALLDIKALGAEDCIILFNNSNYNCTFFFLQKFRCVIADVTEALDYDSLVL